MAPKGTTHIDTGPSNSKWLRINDMVHDYWCGAHERWVAFEGGHNKLRAHWKPIVVKGGVMDDKDNLTVAKIHESLFNAVEKEYMESNALMDSLHFDEFWCEPEPQKIGVFARVKRFISRFLKGE